MPLSTLKLFAVSLLLLFSQIMVNGQDGSLDVSFGNNGILKLDLGSDFDSGNSIAIQADGKIICGGTSKIQGGKDFALVRLNEDGTLDESFGSSGISTTDFNISLETLRAIALRDDGKIISIGRGGSDIFDFAITCHNADGTIDTNFGDNGRVITDIDLTLDYPSSVIMLDENKFLVAGGADYPGFDTDEDSDFAVVKYNQDGSLDQSFGSEGKVMSDIDNNSLDAIKAIELLPDGKIVAVGYTDNDNGEDDNFAIVRYHADGNIDTSFGTNGIVIVDFDNKFDLPNDLAIQPDGKIVIVGYSKLLPLTEFAIIRLLGNGEIDHSFGEAGKQLISFNSSPLNQATSVAIQKDDKIVISGFSYQGDYNCFSMARLNENGQIDSTFGIQGKVITDFNANSASNDMLIQEDNKLVLIGISNNQLGDTTNFGLARYTVDLVLNNTETKIRDIQLKVYPNPVIDDLSFQFDLLEKNQLSLYLLDNTGKVLQTYFKQKEHIGGLYNYQLETSNLKSGAYYLVLSDPNNSFVQRIIK